MKKMKKNILISLSIMLFMIASIGLSSCKCKKNTQNQSSTSNSSYVEGTVKQLPNLIGACSWVIELNDGTRLEPRELKEEFLVDGRKIKFEYEELEGLKSKCMTGKIVKIISVL